MKEAVIIKSYQNGISLYLNEEMNFQDILEEIKHKFFASKSFFGSAKVALSLEGRVLSNAQESEIVDAIIQNSNLSIMCLVGKNEDTNKSFMKALQKMDKMSASDSECQFHKGTLKNRETIETEDSIVILGDVNPGCAVISSKNIIILGGLYGEAYAGNAQDASCYVVSLEMEPERLKIGDFKYKENAKQAKWGIYPKVQPKIAYIKGDKIVCEPLTKDKLSSF